MFVCGECGSTQDQPGPCRVDHHPVSPIGDDLMLGTTLGAYRVARLIGVGGMGRVYKGVHPHIGSRVAIKLLSRDSSDHPQLVDRFFAEARAVNLVNHEGIVNVLDLAVLPDRRPYIVMEYLDGAPLSAILDGARAAGWPPPLGGAARVAVEVLDALAAAHAKGIVHRDLKPDNIFITPAGRSKILDFGIAKLLPEYSGMAATHTGSLLGTPQYMSPEQAAGRPADARADLYAIGCILYECATLQRPFYADSVYELLRRHIEEPVRPPRSLRPDMPHDLEQVILVALAKAPEQRFASALAMSQALQSATASLPADQWTPLVPSGSSPPPRAHPSWGARPTPMGPPTPMAMAMAKGPTMASIADLGRRETAVAPSPPSAPPPAPAPTPAPVAAGGSGNWQLTAIIIALIVVGGGVTAVALTRSSAHDADEARTASADPPAPAPAPTSAKPVAADPNAAKSVQIPVKPQAEEDPDDKAIDQSVANILNATADNIRTAPTAPAAPAGWIARHELTPPAGYAANNFDADAYIKFAIAEARREVPDAQLIRIDLPNVDASGHVHIMGVIDAAWLRFESPARSRVAPSDAVFRIEASPTGIEIRSDGMAYDAKLSPAFAPPRCPIARVWKKLKFPAGTESAEVSYYAFESFPATWHGSSSDTIIPDCN